VFVCVRRGGFREIFSYTSGSFVSVSLSPEVREKQKRRKLKPLLSMRRRMMEREC
jgi:hypothetical protein